MKALYMRVLIVILLASCAAFGAVRENARRIRMRPGAFSTTVRGTFGSANSPVKYRFAAHVGQRCRVRINPDGDLDTAGHVFFPGSQEGDGGPGGIIYDGVLPKTGDYRVWVEYRGGNTKTFSLELTCR
jgi:hypothetical protein